MVKRRSRWAAGFVLEELTGTSVLPILSSGISSAMTGLAYRLEGGLGLSSCVDCRLRPWQMSIDWQLEDYSINSRVITQGRSLC